MLNPHIFRAYDIRGIADQDLTEETMYLIGKATGTYFKKELHFAKVPHLVIGRDNRLSGEKLQRAFIQGLLETDCSVTNIGLSTTPLIYYAACAFDFDGGINITASHNPKEYNGVKIVKKKAISTTPKELQYIRELAEQESKKLEMEKTENIGVLKEDTHSMFDHYMSFITSHTHLQKPPKIVIDAGNGITGIFAPKIFRALGANVIELYCELDGNFPNHEADPAKEENLGDLKREALKQKADLGIAFDGDGDRVGIVDNRGKFYNADLLLILFARDILSRNKGAKVVFDVKCSRLLENEIKTNNGIAIMSKTGHTFIEKAMKEHNALLAGEASGHMFFAENYYGFDDGIYAAVQIIRILDQHQKSLKELLSDLPITFTTPEIKVNCPDDKKFEIMEDIVKFFRQRYPSIEIDGIRMNFNDTDWAAIRCSNTGPHITMRFEAQTEENLTNMQKVVFAKLKEYQEISLANADWGA